MEVSEKCVVPTAQSRLRWKQRSWENSQSQQFYHGTIELREQM